MAVALKKIDLKDPDLREFQSNVADAVDALSTQKLPAVGVIKVSANQKLVGNEDVVLVDSSTAIAELFIILPGVKRLQRTLTVKVLKASTTYAVTVKAVDIPGTSSPTIDGVNTTSIPANTTGTLTFVSDGKNYYTL